MVPIRVAFDDPQSKLLDCLDLLLVPRDAAASKPTPVSLTGSIDEHVGW